MSRYRTTAPVRAHDLRRGDVAELTLSHAAVGQFQAWVRVAHVLRDTENIAPDGNPQLRVWLDSTQRRVRHGGHSRAARCEQGLSVLVVVEWTPDTWGDAVNWIELDAYDLVTVQVETDDPAEVSPTSRRENAMNEVGRAIGRGA